VGGRFQRGAARAALWPKPTVAGFEAMFAIEPHRQQDPVTTQTMGRWRMGEQIRHARGRRRQARAAIRARPFCADDGGLRTGLPRLGDGLTPSLGAWGNSIDQSTDGVVNQREGTLCD
jgi:hypothetical protein